MTPCINVWGNVIMISEATYQSLSKELEKAITYNKKGEENKSRVLARQIAGKAVREILLEVDFQNTSRLNPFQCLEEALNKPEIFEQVYLDLKALTRKVNFDYSFPQELDLINSTKKILTFVKQYKVNYG